jgi:hypothetical protein
MAKKNKKPAQEQEQENMNPEPEQEQNQDTASEQGNTEAETTNEPENVKMTPAEFREKVVGKLNKLLVITKENGATDEEAQAALLKAQKLMYKYNISMAQLGADEEIEYGLEVVPHVIGASVRWPLAAILSKNFACRAIQLNRRMAFLGHKMDAKAALAAFEYAWTYLKLHGEALQRERKGEGESTHTVFNTYAHGFLNSLQEKLNEQCVALSIVVPDDVHEEFKKRFPAVQTKKTRMASNAMDVDAYMRGLADGKSVMGKRELPAE